jgi:hypothetical protein
MSGCFYSWILFFQLKFYLMRGLMVALAKTLDFEVINKLLIEAAESCKTDPSRENKNYLSGVAILMGIHLNTEGRPIEEVMRDMENSAQLFQAFKSVQ